MKSKFINTIKMDFPDVIFISSSNFSWSPTSKTISYIEDSIENDQNMSLLLHEVSHYLLDHRKCASDVELLKIEVKAWEKAKKLYEKYGVIEDHDFEENCLNTYRKWLWQTSKCPKCQHQGLFNDNIYRCSNCNNIWVINSSIQCKIKKMSV